MIHGTHLLLNSVDPEADRAFFREVLRLPHVDAGHGWLIFALPPAEVAIHPAEKSLTQPQEDKNLAAAAVYLVCDNLRETFDLLIARGAERGKFRRHHGVSSAVSGCPAARTSAYKNHATRWRHR
jgi:hypothetical protein